MIGLIGLTAYFIGSVVGVLIWGLPLALIVQWRARKLKNWHIRYKDAYFVSAKAGVGTTLIAYGLAFVVYVYLSYSSNYANSGTYAKDLQSLESSLKTILFLVSLGVWAFVHSILIERLATAYGQPVEVANGITPSVLGFGILLLIGFSTIIAVLTFSR